MPFYWYEHDECGFALLLQRKVDECVMFSCPKCKDTVELRPVISRATCPNIMLPAVTNHVYNNGMGAYDMGLGARLESREQHRQIMKDMDVHEVDVKPDEFLSRSTAAQESVKEPSMDYVKDRYEYYRSEVEKGLTREDKPIPDGTGGIDTGIKGE